MKNNLNFLIEVRKLKGMPRTGWVWLEVKNPETIAEHIFSVAIMNWISATKIKPKLNFEKVIKTSLAHDLCEVYAGDMTPYWDLLPKDKTKRKEILKRWIRLPIKEKKRREKKRFGIEKKSLLKLIKFLGPKLKKEIFACWFDYEKGITREGKFVKQIDKIETLIQAIQYFGAGKDIPVVGWWEEVEELVEEQTLLKFSKVIQKKFYGRVPGGYKKQKELENILGFILEIGKLKRMPRSLWVLLGVKNPETVAGHIFTVSLMAWVLGQEKKELNMEKLLKMALSHEICAVYTGDFITPFAGILLKEKKEKRKAFEKWPRLSRKEKGKRFFKDYKKEKIALWKLISKLRAPLREEMVQLFDEYKTTSSPEARFLNQVNALTVLLQALQYQKKDKKLPTGFLWEWILEKCEDPIIFKFIEALKKKFYKSS
ncbi:MAG: HD family hydrolase [Candidatus Paceibacterales bacterium]